MLIISLIMIEKMYYLFHKINCLMKIVFAIHTEINMYRKNCIGLDEPARNKEEVFILLILK
jgi:hypothetical protein